MHGSMPSAQPRDSLPWRWQFLILVIPHNRQSDLRCRPGQLRHGRWRQFHSYGLGSHQVTFLVLHTRGSLLRALALRFWHWQWPWPCTILGCTCHPLFRRASNLRSDDRHPPNLHDDWHWRLDTKASHYEKLHDAVRHYPNLRPGLLIWDLCSRLTIVFVHIGWQDRHQVWRPECEASD